MTDTPSHQTQNYVAPQFRREWDGSLYSTGLLDRYYGKSPEPRWRPGGAEGDQVRIPAVTQSEINEYMAGYADTSYGEKDWG